MSVEPGIIDANVLFYAMDADAPHHAASRALLEAGRNPLATLYVTPQILANSIPLSPIPGVYRPDFPTTHHPGSRRFTGNWKVNCMSY